MPPHSTREQRGVIAGLWLSGRTVEQIVAHHAVTLTEASVRRWIIRFDFEGYAGLRTRPRPGRPRVMTDEQELLINASILARPYDSLKDVVQELTPELMPHMKNIYKRVKKSGIKCRVGAQKPALTDDQKFMRLGWAHDHAHMTVADWNDVIFSDETSHRSDQSRKKMVWRTDGTRYEDQNITPTKPSGRVSLMQWFAMSGNLGGIAALNCPPHMGARFYRDAVLRDTLVPVMAERIGAGTPFRFVQDNAPIHTANIVEQWFDANDHVQKLLWPPYSPDLNPIENFFGLIALEWDARFERTVEALEAHAHEVFNSIRRRPQIFRALASSMPRRIQAVIDNNGGSTKY